MARKPFKMKRSPVKGLLGDIFKGLGVKKTGNIGENLKKKYSSEAQRANEVPRPGESKYQFDVRKGKARNKAKRSMVDKNKDKISDFIQPHSITDPAPKGQERVFTETTETSETREIPWDKAPKVGTIARTNWYKKFNLALDDTTPLTKKSPSKKRGYKMKRK